MTQYRGTPPAWLETLDERAVKACFDSATFDRGAAYRRQRRVLALTATADLGLSATVAGNRANPYSVDIFPGTSKRPIGSSCTCPMRYDCKHAVAVLLAALSWPQPPPPKAAWQKALDPLLANQPEEYTPAALRIEFHKSKSTPIPRPFLKPYVAGKNGWIKTGASWRDIEYRYTRPSIEPAQRSALLELMYMHQANRPGYYSYGEPRLYLDEFGPSVWHLLDRALGTGITLLGIGKTGNAVLSKSPASVRYDITQTDDGSGRLTAELLSCHGTRIQKGTAILGNPGHGYCTVDGNDVELGPIEPPVSVAAIELMHTGSLVIPKDDLPRFLFSYYPTLRRQASVTSHDHSIALPEVSGPILRAEIDFRTNHVTRIAWRFAYRVGAEVMLFELTADAEAGRNRSAEAALLAGLRIPDGAVGGPIQRGMLISGREIVGIETSNFVRNTLPMLIADPGIEVVTTGEPLDYQGADAPATISVRATDTDDPDWFDLAINVRVGQEDVPLPNLLQALSLGEPELLLDSGTSLRLDAPELGQLRDIVAESASLTDRESDGFRITPVQAGLWEELVNLGVVAEQSERWKSSVGALLAIEDYVRPGVPAEFGTELRPYQLDGYHWLCLLWDLRLGGVLADDMGLGKTVQTLAMAAHAAAEGTLGGDCGPLLIVAPTSVMMTWEEQARQFCPHLNVAVLAETQKRGGHVLSDVTAQADIVVTSYALFRIEQDAYRDVQWSGLVLDEAQFVKNHQSKAYQAARKLNASFKLAITGTPIENSVMDLWSMLSITAPGLFPSVKQFESQYRRPIESGTDPERLDTLRRRVRPLMLRRTKETVASDLPPKTEQTRYIPLTPAHRHIYDTQLTRERQRVLGLLDDINRNRVAVLKSLTTLRQLSLDASLVGDSSAGHVASAKIDALVEDLREIGAEGHRALVFSQFTRFLGNVRDRLATEGIATCYLDGRTRDRARRIAEFNDGDATAFLISLKAGGFGLNLTAADYVYILDPWWNPAAEAQAVDRTHRIGQDKPVMVYRLISTGTIEEKVVAMQERKRELFTSIIDGGAAGATLDADDIRALLAP